MKENLFYQKDYWLNFASDSDKNVLSKDLHSSWNIVTQTYDEYTTIEDKHIDILKQNTQMESVLDFGVGMGRNVPYLKQVFKNVYGFDTEPMIKNLKQREGFDKNLYFDWNEASQRKYDLVYESVVMQHIPPQEVIYRLYQISLISKYFVSWTRCYNDFLRDFRAQKFGVNVASLISSLDAFEIVDCSIDLNTAKQSMNETHYKILYKSKNL
ncbi:MAG: class I SAM-dependent methyltransferase [Bacteroidetes bacterium]|nr:class I SAM-dependent methyltransferase [Bacteroidota bacterium]